MNSTGCKQVSLLAPLCSAPLRDIKLFEFKDLGKPERLPLRRRGAEKYENVFASARWSSAATQFPVTMSRVVQESRAYRRSRG